MNSHAGDPMNSNQQRNALEVKPSDEKYFGIFQRSPVGIELFDSKGELTEINQAALDIFGIKKAEEVKSFRLFDDPNLDAGAKDKLLNGITVRQEIKFDFTQVKARGLYETSKSGIHYFHLEIVPCNNGSGDNVSYIAYVRDITGKKTEERERAATIEILRIINRTPDKQELIRKITLFLKNWLECEAIAIRLREGYDFPYYETSGFPEKFAKLEKHLCTYDRFGNPILDENGEPVLECMCGRVLMQKSVPDRPFFTKRGSFWTNSTTELKPTLQEGDIPESSRGRCTSALYESIGLFPLRFGDETFGLLQINDRKPGLFTQRLLDFLEIISDKITLAIMKKRAEDSLIESEARFRSFVENASDMVYSLNLQGIFTYVSPNWKEIFGYDPAEIAGHYIGEFSEPEYRAKLGKFFNDTVQLESTETEMEFRARHKDGSIRWHATRQSLLLDEEGNIKSVLGISRDITERKNYELRLEKYSEELKASNSSKDRLFSILAHDLRGPFAGFLGITKELMEGAEILKRSEISEMAVVMHSTADKLYGLLNNLLEWSRLQINRMPFEQVDINLFREVENTFELFISSSAVKNISLRNHTGRNDSVLADGKMVSAILRNLISNAIKFTNSGGTVILSSEKKDGFMEISVSDNGVGMGAERIGKLFKIEHVVSSRGTNEERGSGLGLVLCKEMIEKNGGKINVVSSPGEGSTFTFTLPASADEK